MPLGGMLTTSLIGGGLAGIGGLAKGIFGLSQNHQASQIEKNNPFPTETIQPEYQKNLNQAQQMSQVGMPQQQYTNQLNSIQQNQAGALGALSNSANPGASLASIVRSGDAATGNLNAQDAVQRNQNLLRLLQERTVMAQQKDKVWDWNSKQKYLGNLAKSQALRGAGNANIAGGLGDISSLGGQLLKGGLGSGAGAGVPEYTTS